MVICLTNFDVSTSEKKFLSYQRKAKIGWKGNMGPCPGQIWDMDALVHQYLTSPTPAQAQALSVLTLQLLIQRYLSQIACI